MSGTRRIALQGPLGTATLVEGEVRGFETANAAIDVEHLRLDVPLSGRLKLENATLLFAGRRCVRAEGRVATDILTQAMDGPEVSGTLACAGDAAVARLEGRMQDLQVDVALRLDAAGQYQVQTRVASANPMVRNTLALAGFAENGDGLLRSDEGTLGL